MKHSLSLPRLGILVALLFVVAASPLYAHHSRTLTIDPDGSTATFPSSINSAGQVIGYYTDPNHLQHGFLRSKNGIFTSFDVVSNATFIVPAAINPIGQIAGYYGDANNEVHGFVRNTNGTITSFDAPGDISSGLGTFAVAINASGQIAGYHTVISLGKSWVHGFLRNTDGTIASFDAPNADWNGGGTTALAINPAGQIAGFYGDANSELHGFLRLTDGTIVSFEVPGSVCCALWGVSISGKAQISGSYQEPSGRLRGFLWNMDDAFNSFDAPGATGGILCGHCYGTLVTDANESGSIVGYYADANQVQHGFLRSKNGIFTSFDASGHDLGGTTPTAINPAGRITGITGYYWDTSGIHGFIRYW